MELLEIMGLSWTHTDTLHRQVFVYIVVELLGHVVIPNLIFRVLNFFIILIIGKGVCEHECRNPWRPEECVGSLGARVIWML